MPTKRKWSASVKTDSTHPPAGLFNKDAATIARTLASKSVSPKGPGSGMRMLTFFINRAGRNLSPKRRGVLNRAKTRFPNAFAALARETSAGARLEITRSGPESLGAGSTGTYPLRTLSSKISVQTGKDN
jgi:Protein of unknown function (DUF3175)